MIPVRKFTRRNRLSQRIVENSGDSIVVLWSVYRTAAKAGISGGGTVAWMSQLQETFFVPTLSACLSRRVLPARTDGMSIGFTKIEQRDQEVFER